MDTFKIQWIADAIHDGYFQLRKVGDNNKTIMKYIKDTHEIKVSAKLVKELINEIPKLKELQKNAAKSATSFKIDYGIWKKDPQVDETSEISIKIEDLIN